MGDRLFISHASEDAAVAERIVAYLEARGVPCWISSRDIPPRAIYADAIVEGMQSCSACAVLVSAASNASKPVKREVELASHEDKDFIPMRIDGSEPASGLAFYLRNVQWVEFRRDHELALDRIVASLAGPKKQPHLSHFGDSTKPTPTHVVGSWQSDGLRVTFEADYTCTIEILQSDGTPWGDAVKGEWQLNGHSIKWTPYPLGEDASGVAEDLHRSRYAYQGHIAGFHIDAKSIRSQRESLRNSPLFRRAFEAPDSVLRKWEEAANKSIRLTRVR